MKAKSLIHSILALAAATGLLALSYWMHFFLEYQQKLASASFEFYRFFAWNTVMDLLLVAAWALFAWYILFGQPPGSLPAILLIALGGAAFLFPFINSIVSVVSIRVWGLLLIDLVRASAAFITTLGILGLLSVRRRTGPYAEKSTNSGT